MKTIKWLLKWVFIGLFWGITVVVSLNIGGKGMLMATIRQCGAINYFSSPEGNTYFCMMVTDFKVYDEPIPLVPKPPPLPSDGAGA